MSLDFLLTCGVFFIGWSFPRFLLPLGSSMVGILLLKGFNPWTLLAGITIAGTLSYLPLWAIEGYAVSYFERHTKAPSSSKFAKLVDYLRKRFSVDENTINKDRSRIKTYLGSKHGKLSLFILAIMCTSPILPDIVTVGIFRKRMSFWLFLLAGFLGKGITFLPIIFVGRGILEIIFG